MRRNRGTLIDLRPDIAAEWHPTKNAGIELEAVAVNAKIRVWWRCKLNHDWASFVHNRTRNGVRKGSGCPVCNPGGRPRKG